jgi:hypothetical protein
MTAVLECDMLTLLSMLPDLLPLPGETPVIAGGSDSSDGRAPHAH